MLGDKLLYLDLETTGVDVRIHGVWQVSGQIVVDGETKEEFDLKCQPLPNQMVSSQAMEATRMSIEELRTLPLARPVFYDFKRMLRRYVDQYDKYEKFTIVGYNSRFDTDFLRAWFENLGDEYYGSWFWHPPIDVMNMAMVMLHDRRSELRRSGALEDFKQSSVAKLLGIEYEGEAHDADKDVKVCRKIFEHLLANTSRSLITT